MLAYGMSVPAGRKGKHRLMQDFAKSKTVRFLGINGQLWDSGKSDPIASVDYRLNVGDCWTEDDK